MRIQLTQKNVRTLGQGEHHDEDLPRLVLRVRNEARTYGLRYERHGKTIRVNLGTMDELTLDQARKNARTLLSKVYVGADPRIEFRLQKVAGITVKDLSSRCLSAAIARGLSPATIESYTDIHEHELEPIAEEIAVGVTKRRLCDFFDEVLPRIGEPMRPGGKRPALDTSPTVPSVGYDRSSGTGSTRSC